MLREISELLELQGVAFKPRAYQRAAFSIESLTEDVEKLVEEGQLGEVPGVGEAIEEKISEFLKTGKLAYLEKLRGEVPAGLRELVQLPHVGPKTAMRLYKELKIASLDALRKALDENRLRGLKGFGEKSEEEIRKSLERRRRGEAHRFDVLTAHGAAEDLEAHMRKVPGVGRVVFTGSYRRGRDTVGDLDLLVEAPPARADAVAKAFTGYRAVRDVLESGATRSRVLLDSGLQVDLRVVPKESFGAAMLYFTGSKDHNIAVRALALRKGLSLNEYALARKRGGKRVAGSTEEEVYQRLDLRWMPPEVRENRGEVELAADDMALVLVELDQVRGDLHTHTNETDGSAPAREMAAAAAQRGYEYYGISDHSEGLRITRGMTGARQRAQRKELDRLQAEFPKMKLLQGSELEIRKDGSLDMTKADRERLDYVIGAVHSAFALDRKEQTARVLRAVEGGIDILAHPTGRQIGTREPIELDLERVAHKAKERDVLLEIDGTPLRLDLSGESIHAAADRGAHFVASSDAHAVPQLDYIRYAVVQARRGWLAPSRVANAQPLGTLERFLGHARRA